MMKAVFALCTLLLAAGSAAAQTPPPAARAQIPFANHGGIYDWRADGEDAIIIESQSHHFYRATFLSPCFDLKYRDRIGFVTDARDVLDKFDSVRVGDQTCQFVSFDEVPKPEKW
jgi:hypothetical protein